MLEIRELREGERPIALELAREFLKQSPYEKLFPPKEDALEKLFVMTEQWGIVLVADVDGDLVGLIAGVIIEHALTGQMYGEEVVWYVKPEHRSGRVGIRLLEALTEWTTTNGATMLKMLAPAESPVGKLLESRGFARVETAFMKLLAVPTVAEPFVIPRE